MAAVLLPEPLDRPRGPVRAAPRHLTLIEGGRSTAVLRRTYLRRRAVALVVVLALAVASFGLARAALRSITPRPVTGPVAVAPYGSPTVVVAPGDSMWSIARRLQPHGDLRALVHRMQAVHGPAPLQVGERVVVPR